MSDIVIGIDLGTTNSCVCVLMNDKLRILENQEGGRITPSYIFFTDQDGMIVGQYAKRMADSKPEYGIYEIKRLVGRKYDDPYIQKNLTYLPFQVKNLVNEPVAVIQCKNQIIKKTPQELCKYILQKLKNDAESKLGHSIDKAVITVPAYFNVAQREVTLDAAKQAGFTVLKLLNEPTAAALNYYFENRCTNSESYSLVYDLGGGTFDVAILKRRDCNIEIIGVDGDSHLGGHDFDNLLVDHVSQILLTKYNYNPKTDRRNMRRLKNECEEVKKILSVTPETTVILTSFLADPSCVEITITREEFEKMAHSLFKKTIDIVDNCLENANLKKTDIKEVILSGGSTRIPKIQAMLTQYFDGKALNKFVNPDECVAEGAAIQAAMLSKDSSQKVTEIQVTDVTSLSLGISNFVDAMTILIHRNTPVPVSKETKRVTIYNNQVSMSFEIYEGERTNAKKNYYLGVLEVSDLTPAPPGQCTVSVKMSIDQNGILVLSATETVSGKTKSVNIAHTRGSRSDSEISKVVVDARENEEEDEKFLRFAEVKGYVIKYCVRAMYNLEEKGLTLLHKTVYERCAEIVRQVKILNADKIHAAIQMKEEIINLCAPLDQKYTFVRMP